jgi:hypothetical protein
MPVQLGKKIGPLSTRAWLIVGGGTLAVVWYVRRKAAATAQATGEPVQADSSTMGDTVDWTPPGSLAGASPSFDSSGVDFAGLQQAEEEQTQTLGDILATLQTPSMEPTPVTIVGKDGKRIKKQIAGVNERIDKIRKGGVTPAEHPKLLQLRQKRKRLKAKL